MTELHFAAVVVLAYLGDIVLGDPPNRFHPVAWMGNAIGLVRRSAPKSGDLVRFGWGIGLVCGGMVFMGVVGWIVQRTCQFYPAVVSIVVQSVVLKCSFSISSLSKAAKGVSTALRNEDIDAARHEVAYHLVSRDVSKLDASKLSAATIESVAENTSDSVIAPLFYFAIAGLPGALAYRFVNTCDAMIGYRTAELEWFGKAAARTDDVLNWLPARITAILILLVEGIRNGRFRKAMAIWMRDHRLTASPNAGHPMSAAAGVLGVVLEKEGHYVLGAGEPKPTAATIEQSIRLLWETSLAGGLLFIATVFLCGWGQTP